MLEFVQHARGWGRLLVGLWGKREEQGEFLPRNCISYGVCDAGYVLKCNGEIPLCSSEEEKPQQVHDSWLSG